MKYDFTTVLDRVGKDAIAVDAATPEFKDDYYYLYRNVTLREGFEFIPMGVADMNFPVCPTIIEAMKGRLEHPTFGYFSARNEYYESIIDWQEHRNGVQGLKREHIGYENGVLGGVASALRSLVPNGSKVLVHAPTYIGFSHVMQNAGYEAVSTPLVRDENGIMRMDYEDMDKKLREQNIHVAILCSPHNPSGRVWERWELEKAMEIYEKNDCYVISDEIWSDIILYGHKHIPTQSINKWAREHVVAFYAPSKTFSLAGLIGSYHVVYSKYLRDLLRKEESLCHYNSINLMSMYSLIGAYKPEGHQWVDEMRKTIEQNVDYAYEYIHKHFKGVTLEKPQGTYLLVLDCDEWLKEHTISISELHRMGMEVGVGWQNGEGFHMPRCIRMNLALPLSKVEEAFGRLNKYVFNA